MKNIIVVDVDTDRTPVVQIGKMEKTDLPKNTEEAKMIIIKDMACLSEALCVLINAADQSGFKSIDESMKDIITHLERGTIIKSEDTKEEEE